MEDCGGVAEGAAWPGVVIDVAGDEGDVADFGVQGLESLEVQGDELGFENEVLGRVAGDGEFGGEDQFGSLCREFAIGAENFLKIAVEIADGGVDLGKSDLHSVEKQGS